MCSEIIAAFRGLTKCPPGQPPMENDIFVANVYPSVTRLSDIYLALLPSSHSIAKLPNCMTKCSMNSLCVKLPGSLPLGRRRGYRVNSRVTASFSHMTCMKLFVNRLGSTKARFHAVSFTLLQSCLNHHMRGNNQ